MTTTRAIKQIIRSLRNEDQNLSRMAFESLVNLGELAVPPLCEALGRYSLDVRKVITNVLISIGEPAVVPLCLELLNGDNNVRMSAALALGSIRDSRAVVPLCGVLSDADVWVRRFAVEALGRIAHGDASEALCAALVDRDGEVRSRVSKALTSIGKPSVEPLCRVMKNKSVNARITACHALGVIKDPCATDVLLRCIDNANPAIRTAATNALGNMCEGRAVAPLCGLLDDPDTAVRRAAARSLGMIGSDFAVKHLCDALADEHCDVRYAAAEALRILADVDAIVPLCGAIADLQETVRRKAAEALASIGEPAVQSLCAIVGRKESREAAAVLYKIGVPNDLPLKILTKSSMPLKSRIAALNALSSTGQYFDGRHTKRYRTPNAMQYCTQMSSDSDASIRRAAAEMLSYLHNDLLIPTQRDKAVEASQLLRPVTGQVTNDTGEELLRPAVAPADVGRRIGSFWRRLRS